MNDELNEVIKRLSIIFNKRFGYDKIIAAYGNNEIKYSDRYNCQIEFTCWYDSYSYILDVGFLYSNSDLTSAKRIFILTEIVSNQYINDYNYSLNLDKFEQLDDILKSITLQLNRVFLIGDFSFQFSQGEVITKTELEYYYRNSVFVTFLSGHQLHLKRCYISLDIKLYIPSLIMSSDDVNNSCETLLQYLIFEMLHLIRQQINICAE